LITHPLTVKQIKSSNALQAMQTDKEWVEIQKKYKNDKDRLAQEQMRIYKERGISPFASCLPTLIQFRSSSGCTSPYPDHEQCTFTNAQPDPKISPWLVNVFSFLPGLAKPISLIPLNNEFLWMNLGQPERYYIRGFHSVFRF
jgi:YidC/Oxa1 family membrane protein insertase